ncbi:MAG: 4-phosphoerythronate dehydrogenase [Bacteroidales bacterium]|nr:4-phosphoerythronate dehydrogenase [Bacteroidales bacterium]MBR1577460.1 4-phosphoerythronate dehydrogenase [Bacteroidales bacterium]
MKFVIDKAIPFVEGVFEPFAEVIYKEGPDIAREDLLDADALVIRTRTRCDAALLEGTSVKIIATATVSMDNIDLAWCKDHGIFVRNASGCNAGGVTNYVFSALYGTAARKSISLSGATLGIIGLGSAGSRVEEMGLALGFKTLRYDPWRAAKEGPSEFCDLDTVLAGADVVTLHIPVNDSTRGMADAAFFARMKPGAFFINTAQGELVVEEDLIRAIPRLGPVALDTWCHEPDINRTLLDLVDIATPHIAGYTLQGKQIGTSLAIRAVARFFGLSGLYDFFPTTEIIEYQAVHIDAHDKTQGQIASVIQYNYPIFTDDFMFRMAPDRFSEMRANYSYRREFYF